MNDVTFNVNTNGFKPLPSPAKEEKLPPLPPPISELPLPSPPPKIVQDGREVDVRERDARPALRPPPISTANGDALNPGLPDLPLTPVSPGSPSEGKAKRSNPLVDLVETEKAYVDQLAGVIRKVASAWSRTNLPPPELDGMFRSIETVYKANRALHSKLKEIGTNPSSPKALGDLLMRWIDDLESPYTAYCNSYYSGLDTWPPITTNTRLPIVLATFSASLPPPLPPNSPQHPSSPPLWTVDQLFLLPKGRLKYYRKLYGRLLKSTVQGRSDWKLLVGAVERLDRLLGIVESRTKLMPEVMKEDVDEHEDMRSRKEPTPEAREVDNDDGNETRMDGRERESQRVELGEDEVVIDTRGQSTRFSDAVGSASSSTRGSSLSSGERLSRETVSTSIDRGSTSTLSTPATDLERRLATDRVMDIFTMKPKQVRLQISPPTLTYPRALRSSCDVAIHFTPRATGVEVVHRQGHIFLLTDLFLICERIRPEERAGMDGADMWLCYPPLAGKHLRVTEVEGSDNAVYVTILKKEVLRMHTESAYVRNKLIADMTECIEFAASVAPSKQTPPPVPPLKMPIPRSGQSTPSSGTGSRPPSAPLPSGRVNSPPTSMHEQSMRSPSPSQQSLNRSLSNMSVTSPGAYPQQGPPVSFASFAPGQIVGPARSTSIGSGTSAGAGPSRGPGPGPGYGGPPGPPRGFGPGQVMGPGPGQMMPPRKGPGPMPMSNQGYGPPPPPPNHYPPQQYPQQQYPQQQQHPPPRQPPGPYGPPQRSPSDPYSHGPPQLRKVASTPSMAPQYEGQRPPPVPALPGGYSNPNGQSGASYTPRSQSYNSLQAPQPRTLLPSTLNARAASVAGSGASSFSDFQDLSPPTSPVEEEAPKGPITSTIVAEMKCKVFLQQHHAQWKSLGAAKLKLYAQRPTNMKQLVVEAQDKNKSILISTIVLSDGVERVGKTGVAIELSDKGARTGIIYMIQLRNEDSSQGLFDSLLAGSDRAAMGGR